MTTPTQDVFELVLLRPAVSPLGEHPTDALLTWRAPQQGERFVQVYVDGELVDVSPDEATRALWLTLDRAAAHRVELLAVDPADAWRNLSDHLNTWSPAPQAAAELGVLRDEALPPDAVLRVSIDGEHAAASPLWPGDVERSGFGGLFGLGSFGYDDAAGPGLGLASLGEGPLGRGGSAWRFRETGLPAGEHTLTMDAIDATGHALAPPITQPITIDRPPSPPRDVSVSPDFVLTWSPDDA